MPLTGIFCPCGECCGAEVVSLDEALDHAAKRKGGTFPYELLASMFAQVQDRGDRISTTTLTAKCFRSEWLRRRREYVDTPEKMYAAFRGTLYHGQLELYAHPRAIAEARYHVDLDGLGPFSCSPDLVDPVTGHLYDYKTNKENPRWDKPWADHVEQVQINRWVVDHATRVEFQGEEFDLSDRANRSRFVPLDWQGLVLVYLDDKGPKPLLVTRSEQVPKKDGKGTKAARVADIWPDDRVEALVRRKYADEQEAFRSDTVPAVPPGFENWEHPLCNYCPVRGDCVEEFINEKVAEQVSCMATSR